MTRKEDVETLKSYLRYTAHLDTAHRKSLLNDFMRRHVQDIAFAPLVSEKAVELAKKKGITAGELAALRWPYKNPGSGIPDPLRPLFTDSARGKAGSKKVLHFEHDIPAAQAAEKLAALDPASADIDREIEAVLAVCRLCLITVAEDNALTEKQWGSLKRPPKAYEKLEEPIKLVSLKKACGLLDKP